MNLTYNTTTIFPTIIHQFDIGGFEHIKGQLIDYSYNLKKKDPVGTKLSNHGGWQSTSFPVTTKEDVLQSLLINCLSKFPSVSESVNITISAWVNINKTGDYNVRHTHPDCDLSGVYYIQGEGTGSIKFATHEQMYFMVSPNMPHSKMIAHEPKDGDILLFPSYLLHEVTVNTSSKNRITVGFNIKLDLQDSPK